MTYLESLTLGTFVPLGCEKEERDCDPPHTIGSLLYHHWFHCMDGYREVAFNSANQIRLPSECYLCQADYEDMLIAAEKRLVEQVFGYAPTLAVINILSWFETDRASKMKTFNKLSGDTRERAAL